MSGLTESLISCVYLNSLEQPYLMLSTFCIQEFGHIPLIFVRLFFWAGGLHSSFWREQ